MTDNDIVSPTVGVSATGDPLPAFEAASTGGIVRSSDLAGRKLVLYFYPKDATPGCTTETRDFGEKAAAFDQASARLFGVSRDSLRSHENFKASLGLPFDLISDPDEALCQAFGVMKNKNMYGKQVRGVERSTFVFDAAGKLARAWRGVKVPGHVDEVLAIVEAL